MLMLGITSQDGFYSPLFLVSRLRKEAVEALGGLMIMLGPTWTGGRLALVDVLFFLFLARSSFR